MNEESPIEQRVLYIRRQLPHEPAEVFRFCVTPNLLEQWSAPGEMELSVPLLEPRVGGEYRYEHSDASGVWTCTGHFKEFQRNERLVMLDHVVDPRGRVAFEALECILEFKDLGGGATELRVRQKGFPTMGAMRECKQAWKDCLDKLEALLPLEGSLHASRRRVYQAEAR